MARKRLYRSPRGKIFGVCAGIAEWRDLNVDIVRLIVGISILSTGFFPGALIYLGIALIVPMAPVYEPRDEN
ncbi:MAG: PspC domain-containing protein, partial [Sphaerochaeta sp.]